MTKLDTDIDGVPGQILYSFDEIDFVAIAIVLAVAGSAIFVLKRFLPWLATKLPDRQRFHVLPWLPLLRLFIVVAAIAKIVPLVVRPTPENLIAVFGASAIALGFAIKDWVSSLVAGLVAVFEKPYRVGDWVTIDGVYGEVVAIGFRSLDVVTPDDTVVTVPHSKIWSSAIHNENSGRRELQVATDFYLRPDHDAEAVRQLLWDIGITSPYLAIDRPVVVVVAERPFATHYRLKAYPIDGRDQFLFRSDLTIRAKDALARLGVVYSAQGIAGQVLAAQS